MAYKIKKIFGKMNGIMIGAVHLPPNPGYPDYPGFSAARRNAFADARAFLKGGLDGIIFENNYDLPHTETVDAPGLVQMALLGRELRGAFRAPMGVNVLWNDHEAGLSLAGQLGLQFIRVPVFVDKVRTDYGVINGRAGELLKFRKKIGADRVALFTDIHVKHAKLLSRHTLAQSARIAIRQGSDALIVTGNWTGQAPQAEELMLLRRAIGDFPVLVGSGADEKNVKGLLRYANGIIVSTSLKEGGKSKKEVNVKGYDQRISAGKTKALVRAGRG